MAALVAVQDCLFFQRNSMLMYHFLYRFQHKIHLQRLAQHIGKDLLRASAQDRGEIAERAVQRNIGDIRQQDASRSVYLKLPLHKVFRRLGRPDRLLHPPVRICFADRTDKTEFLHQPPDLLSVHPDAGMQQTHMDAAHAFGVTTKPVSLQNLLEIRRILCLTRGSLLLGGKPRVIAGTGDARDLTQLGYCENVRFFHACVPDDAEFEAAIFHTQVSESALSGCRISFFKNAICC